VPPPLPLPTFPSCLQPTHTMMAVKGTSD
jgi:hypothetical protein